MTKAELIASEIVALIVGLTTYLENSKSRNIRGRMLRYNPSKMGASIAG